MKRGMGTFIFHIIFVLCTFKTDWRHGVFDGNDMSPLVMFTWRCCELQVASVDDCVDLTIVDNFQC